MSTREYLVEQLRSVADDIIDAEFALSDKRRNRDALIRSARDAGVSLRDIGDICMVSHQTVANIVERGAADASATTR